MSTFVTRTLTAAVFVIVMLFGLYGGRMAFCLLFGLINVLCLWEFYGIVLGKTIFANIRTGLGVILGSIPYWAAVAWRSGWYGDDDYLAALTVLIPLLCLFILLIAELFEGGEQPFTQVAHVGLGVFYIGLPFAMVALTILKSDTYQPNVVMGVLLLTWANDTWAYLIGSRIGKTPLMPRISPKKTWEGTLGGIFCTFLMAALLSWIFKELPLRDWLGLAFVVTIFGSLGDLVESMLKRSYGVKDSGAILPGHGGMLDRFDAFIFEMPFVYAWFLFFA